jgi:hypothetical protein
MAFIRWILALLTIAYALFNAIAPVSTLLYKLQTQWPQGWAAAQKALSFPTFTLGGVGANRFTVLMQATNWLQVGMWLLADLLYIVSAFRLMGRRSRGAAPVFFVALLLDVATWLTFKRMAVYNATFSANDQNQDLVIFGVVAVLGVLVWLTGSRRKAKGRTQPAVLTG